MTGLLCITALTNEHSNKGELKDQCMCVCGRRALHMCGSGVVYLCIEETYRGKCTKRDRKQKEGGGSASLRAWDPRCVTTEEALNNSHDIDSVTLLPTSLPRPGRESPPVGSCSPLSCRTQCIPKTHIMNCNQLNDLGRIQGFFKLHLFGYHQVRRARISGSPSLVCG